ncbi:hypothetical protein J1614_011517 [Plenodomus biglobosus]|nr:hypothetical protein J1614_011517 [Plenodomus biglobosus]
MDDTRSLWWPGNCTRSPWSAEQKLVYVQLGNRTPSSILYQDESKAALHGSFKKGATISKSRLHTTLNSPPWSIELKLAMETLTAGRGQQGWRWVELSMLSRLLGF